MEEKFIIANRTDVGNAREVNEDSMVTFDSPNGRVIAVCDGMGGQAAGDVASRLACDIITDILENNVFSSPTEAITRAILAANQGILHRASQNPELEGMGATCVMVIIKDGLVYYGWVGDSRIYYIANHTIRQISRDQSYVQSLVDAGQITQEEAEVHPQKNEITNALGIAGMTPPELCVTPLSPEPESVVLLCSDGLSGMVNNARIEHIVSETGLTLQQKADKLVAQANANGGLDNITIQMVQFGKKEAIISHVKKRFLLWGIFVAVIAITAVVVILLTGNDSDTKKQQKVINTETVDTRKNSVKQTSPTNQQPPTQNTTQPQKETTVINHQTKKTKQKRQVIKNDEKEGENLNNNIENTLPNIIQPKTKEAEVTKDDLKDK